MFIDSYFSSFSGLLSFSSSPWIIEGRPVFFCQFCCNIEPSLAFRATHFQEMHTTKSNQLIMSSHVAQHAISKQLHGPDPDPHTRQIFVSKNRRIEEQKQ